MTTQPKQMPIRHPLGMRMPASSPASRIGVLPSASTVAVAAEEGDLAALAGLDDGGAEALGVEAVGDAGAGPVGLGGVEQAGGPAGPRLALAPVGHEGVEAVEVEDAVLVVEVEGEREARVRGIRPELVREDDVGCRGRAVHVGDVGSSPRWLRSIPMTGVMPLPRGEEEDLGGRGARQGEVAGGLVEHDEGAGLVAAHQVGARPCRRGSPWS